jgi:hypothetical protein
VGLSSTNSNRPSSEYVRAFSQENNLVRISICRVMIYKVLFSTSNYAFCKQERFNYKGFRCFCKTSPYLSFRWFGIAINTCAWSSDLE